MLIHLYRNGTADSSFTPEEFTLSAQIMTYWANFTTYGDPNGRGRTTWPQYHARARGNTLVLDIQYVFPPLTFANMLTLLYRQSFISSWDSANCEKWGSFFN